MPRTASLRSWWKGRDNKNTDLETIIYIRELMINMMNGIKLKRVSIRGFKSYGQKQDIELRDVNVLIGANGSGKSNFISFLEMISYLATDGFHQYVAKNGFSRSILYNGKGIEDQITGILSFSDNDREDEYYLSIMPSAAGGLYIEKEKIVYRDSVHNLPYEKTLSTGHTTSGLMALSQKDKTAGTVLKLLRDCKIFHFNDTTMNARIRTPAYLYDNIYLRSDAGNLASFLFRLKTTVRLKKYYDRIVRMVREVFSRFDDFVLDPVSIEGADESLRLNWKEKGIDEIFGPHMLSDGTLRFIALATLLLQPGESIPGVIILDEPELGLHPYAVRVLGKMIRIAAKHSQIIIATQSAALINEFDYSDIMIADYNQQMRGTYIHRLDRNELAEWLNDYSLGELWEKSILGGTPD